MAERKLNSAMAKVVNKHADELSALSPIARIAKADAAWCKQRVQKISEIWDGTVKTLGVAVSVGLVALWVLLTRGWYYAESCVGTDCTVQVCPSFWGVVFGGIISLVILAGGFALTWWLARKGSIENLCSRR